ncbi:UDP-2,4-diacetamido-2,4,6-trideoxy-beta-L-altropyranose hydrolase [Marinobacter shengliensis]|uniref:UDP-2,4-diacetamido-2,4, 6-trideoxy-beta-L-altropyranose hydrolase n=1 Tax=Marinobacter shengliensis TaxID=1389223 RepID=UPI000D0F2E57|nr:UDP-2,4-diacetamido-2,4,6-trideoxy-beta-L-altropyranose hydrolase [Marinobacter shengliensis]PSF12969.1 UDP-2,4-diacetamido-2,4,6-trideoxy-beta-L-altropyranose hydrolase [Marinobacter shengliensis]
MMRDSETLRLAPTVAIRVDSGHEIGSGHVRRCMSLAAFLVANGFKPVFICREIAGAITHVIEQAGFALVLLPEKESLAFSVFRSDFATADFERMAGDAEESADTFAHQYPGVQIAWVVTDHMLIRKPWQVAFASKTNCKVLAIDGQANSAHYADVLLDPQIHENPVEKWADLLPQHCVVFAGPSCLPLSQAFESARNKATVRQGPPNKVLVCFGGTDPEDLVCRTVNASFTWVSQSTNPGIEVDVAVPASLPSLTRLEALFLNKPNFHLHVGLNDLSQLMLDASVAIGGGGIMLWERCLLGLPAIVVPLAQNQEKPIERLEAQGAVVSVKSRDGGYEFELIKALQELSQNPAALRTMSKNAFKVMSDWPKTDGWLRVMKGSKHE